MRENFAVKTTLVVILGAAALGHGIADRFTLGLLAFGILNAVVFAPGTAWIRAAAVAGTAIALLSSTETRTIVAVLLWLIWPPAFMVAWAVARERDDRVAQDDGHRARVVVAAVIAAVAGASLAFRVIVSNGLQQTAGLFVGVPALLAIIVVLWLRPRSAVGVACKAVTVGLLVSLLFLGEGILCVAMSAPIFYAIAVLIGLIAGGSRGGRGPSPVTVRSVAILVVVPLSFEGVTDALSFNRDEHVSVTRVVAAPAADVHRALLRAPRFDRIMPPYLRVGFPRPVATRFEASESQKRLVIRFRGGEMRLDGIEPRTGDLILTIEEVRPGRLRWRAVSDDSHMTHFLNWREALVEWTPVDAHSTRVTWTLRYRRGLDPAWYFGPWERYAVTLAVDYLITSVATP